MSKVTKKIALACFSVMLFLCLAFGLIACASESVYNISVESTQHGIIVSDVSKAKAGNVVTLTVTPDEGYYLSQLLVNEEEITSDSTEITFVMPAKNVVVKGTFELEEEIVEIPDNAAKEALPAGTALTLNAKAPAGDTAISNWNLVYGETGLEVTVYVQDKKIINDKDAVTLYVGLVGESTLSSVNYGVKVYPDGGIEQYAVSNGAYGITENGAFGATAVLWLNGGSTIAGYKISMSISYEKLGLTEENAEGQIAILPALSNGDSAGSAFGAITAYYNDIAVNKPGSYLALVETNVVKENEDLDILFAGASYVEWWQTDAVFENMISEYGFDTVDVGAAGTQIYQWNNEEKIASLKKLYNPENIVFHVGLNDVNDAGHDVATVTADLKEMYEAYHVAFPAAKLYWVGYIPNNTFSVNNVKYYEINHNIAEWADENDWFEYIDVWNVFCQDGLNGDNGSEIKTRTNMFRFNDGMHMNAPFGYPLWGAIILEALGYERDHGGDFGDYDGEFNKYYYSWGWSADESSAVNTGTLEQAIYYSKLDYETDILFEAEIKSTENTGADAFPKVGLALRNDNVTIFAYFDLAADNIETGLVDIVYRTNNDAGYPNDWSWGSQAGGNNTNVNITTGFGKVAIAKLGSKIYMLVGGEVVASMDVPGVSAESKFIAGVIGFNRVIEVRNAKAITDKSEIDLTVSEAHTITATEYKSVEIDVAESAKKTQNVEFTVTTQLEIKAVYINYNGKQERVESVSGVYSFTMPDADVTITIEFNSIVNVNMTAVENYLTVDNNMPDAGDTIAFTAKANYVIVKLYANGIEIEPDNGVYTLTVSEDVNITGEFLFTTGGVVLDGEQDEAYGNVSTVAEYSGDRTITVKAVKTEEGLWIYVVAEMTSIVTDGTAWHLNTDFEFQLNASGQRYVSINGENSGVTDFKWITEGQNGNYTFTVEIFVAKDLISSYDKGDVQLNYAWKTPGEMAHITGTTVGYVAITDVDWLAVHEYGGLNTDYYTEFGYKGMPRNLFISDDGISLIARKTAGNATIDGNLEEFEGKTVLERGDAAKASFKITGFTADDGLYLGFTITHGDWSSYANNTWSLNDNIELRINNIPTAIVWINGEIILTNLITEASSITTTVDGKLVTTAEVFVAGIGDVYRLQIGCAGNGFGGWQELAWGTQVYFRANDIVENDPIVETITNANITLDGEFNENYWTDEVKSKTFTTEANGATITLMGVNTSAGVMLGITIIHSKPVNEHIQQDGTAWWHFMNFEFRLGGNNWQFAASVYSGQTYVNQCRSGYKTVDNGDGTYTTTIEIVTAHYPTFNDGSSDVIIAMGGVFETGFAWLFGGNATTYTHVITPNGMTTI